MVMALTSTPENVAEQMAEAQRQRARGQYSNLRNQLEIGYSRSGLGRSGFALEGQERLGLAEADEMAAVEAEKAGNLMELRRQQAEIDAWNAHQEAIRRAKKKAKKKKRRNRWIGAALGAVSIAAAPFTAGMSLAALPSATQMAM